MRRFIPLLVLCLLAGCAPRYRVPGGEGSAPPLFTAVTPGQSLTVRLENGGTAIVTAGQPYVSALGENCARVTGQPGIGAVCQRNNEWIGLPDIFLSRPGDGVRP